MSVQLNKQKSNFSAIFKLDLGGIEKNKNRTGLVEQTDRKYHN